MYAIGKVDIGKRREKNQDSIFVSNDSIGILPNLLIVADGMGGHKAGEVASDLAIKAFCDYISSHDSIELKTREDVTILLKLAIKHANKIVYDKSQLDDRCKGMGTTMTAITVIDDIVYLAHVGDTRMYLINDTSIFQATTDHSLVQEMVEKGYISQDDMSDHPQRHIITRAVGTYATIKVDTLIYSLSKVKYLLMCSDGLSGMVTNEEMHQILNECNGDIDAATNSLIDLANEHGGVDNISVIIAKKQEVNETC